MKLIESKVELIEQQSGIEGIYKQIELAGRTCYKSEDKITSTSAKEFADRMINSNHCYTGTSEVLTEKGWISWSSYTGEKVAVVDNNGYCIGFEIPNRIIKHSYTGNFYYYPSLGLEVTDGHRMYGLFRESKNDFYNSTLYDTFVCGSLYKDNNGRQKTLGERMFKVPKHCSVPIHTDPFYELVGFWLGDGCHQAQTVNKLIFHLKKERKIKYLQNLCNELGYTLETCKSNYYKVCSPQIGAKFTNLFYNNGKYIPNMYMAENPVAVRSIILGLINSDGSIGINTKTITFTSTSLSIIQWINNVAVIGGFTVSFRGVCHNTSVHNPVYKIFILDTDYTINNDSRNQDSKVRITNKTEDVYCVTVSTGLIIVRGDNGVTSICGNCAVLEHGTVYLSAATRYYDDTVPYENNVLDKYKNNKFSKVNRHIEYGKEWLCVTTNYRVLVENNWLSDLQYICEPTEFHEKRMTARFTCDRGVSHEFVRHRVFSFAQESTRFCNYSKDKFDNQITYIIPSWCTDLQDELVLEDRLDVDALVWGDIDIEDINNIKVDEYTKIFLYSCIDSELNYIRLINKGYKPQQARQVLPNALKTELVMTGFESDWEHFFKLRCAPSAHPDARKLALELKELIYGKQEE